ncbi:aminotransferase class I/II-fold pyridoxal phosphate-dependent enzyme [Streptomyces californicus]|uniref:aminotransferase class I/II-fold pyridoxal phosphate-dependent enzyme n=1 Tax=Streptomyces TaxID=1883 RepID=UPI000BF0D7E1|nr:aminotransferase class I/II-fold pyridoxal phosphate-dependent enzyme [Streptomyces sp. sk226]
MYRELAILGGVPEFAEPLHVGRPNVPDQESALRRIKEAIDRRWLTHFGPLVQQFERDLARTAGVKHAIAMCNASIALQMLIRASGLKGEVILPSFTFVATAHTLQWEGVTPVFCEIDEKTGNIDPAHARQLITERTTGIMGVHLWGHPAPTDELQALADEHGLRLFYDSAHAIGSHRDGRPVGGFGDAEVYSFHATKFINSFEGGAVVTDDDALAERIRAVHNYGRVKGDYVSGIGTNAKMTEIAAAMGVTSLENMPYLIDVNRERYEHYLAGLDGIPGIALRRPLPENDVNHQYVVLEVDEAAAGLGRDGLVAALKAENVLARTYFHPGCHRAEPYVQDPARHTPLPLPRTERLSGRVVNLPTGTGMTVDDVDRLCALIRAMVSQSAALRSAVA